MTTLFEKEITFAVPAHEKFVRHVRKRFPERYRA
jgi:hypothetical protein